MSKKKHGRGTGNPEPVDMHVGDQIRKARGLMGVAQEKLAEAVNITFQQIQKYEKGTNRVSCSKIHQIAEALDMPISYFFPDQRNSNQRLLDRLKDLRGCLKKYEDDLKAIRKIAGGHSE